LLYLSSTSFHQLYLKLVLERHRETQRERETHTHTDRERQREVRRERESERDTQREKDRQIETEILRVKKKLFNKLKETFLSVVLNNCIDSSIPIIKAH